MFKCTRCQNEFPDDKRLATVEEPYCQICWMIVYYEFPAGQLKEIEAMLEKLKLQGQTQEALDRILMGELKRHADKMIKQKLSQVTAPRLRACGDKKVG